MDYPKKENLNKFIETFFKWQWKIMQKDNEKSDIIFRFKY